MALKHRQGKNHKSRIVVFIGSPLLVDQSEFLKLGKRLKKEKVNVDIINFGEEERNKDMLNEFINTINGKEGTGSHLVSIAAPANLTDALFSSPVVQGEDGSGLPAGFGPGYQYGMEDDPELAMALRISMEEQRLRQEAEAKKSDGGEKMDMDTAQQGNEDALLQQALQMSLGQAGGSGGGSKPLDISSMTEEEMLNYALQISMAQAAAAESASKEGGTQSASTGGATTVDDADMKEDDDDVTKALNDPEFLQRVISELPDVDPTSEIIRNAFKKDDKDKDKDNKEKK